ncbi:MAG: HAD family hydrolase [Lachnospiraceae bacterium]|nr:HAD family hydrolase [Lachnospiraceae bacterium]
MKYKAIMFDLDGTLIPMDYDVFTKYYFKGICKKAAENGITDSENLVKVIWAGTKDMVMNDGSRPNEEAFWERFTKETGIEKEAVNDFFLDYYRNEFGLVKNVVEDNPLAKVAVDTAREKAQYVILATNPLFPMDGQRQRMSWVDLKENDFDLVTCYESDYYCKPNPQYFTEICKKFDLDPKECLMIGNDENEDMYAATQAGFSCFLVTDTMIKSEKHPWDGPRGSFEEMVEMLKAL